MFLQLIIFFIGVFFIGVCFIGVFFWYFFILSLANFSKESFQSRFIFFIPIARTVPQVKDFDSSTPWSSPVPT